MKTIDVELLNQVSAQAKASERLILMQANKHKNQYS